MEARVIDLDGVYDPCRPNDRLLLGMKGSISEFELGIIRSRMCEAARSKAKRGELKISAPIGYAWDRHVGLGLDPDRRLQEVIRLVFHKFRELGSARQVLLWMASQNIHFPYPSDGWTLTSFEWRPIRYRNIISILKNPFYAGVYAYGKSEKRTAIVDGRARKSYGHRKPMGTWEVFIQDHHEGYISWAEYERNQALLAGNAYGRVGDTKSGRGGRALLAGLICCARCGRRLSVFYTGRYPRPVYRCEQPNVQLGQRRCLTVAGKRIDETASLNRIGMPTGQGKTWTAHRVGSVRRVRGIHGYRPAEKNGEWLTMRDAAARLGVSHHQIRKLIKAGVLASEQIMPDAPHQIRAADLVSERVVLPHSNERAARVGPIPKTRSQCFQTLEKGVQYESVIANPRRARSAALFVRQTLPSSMKRANRSQRLSM